MDYYDRDHAEHAEKRRRERLARQERRAAVRRKRMRVFVLVATVFVASYATALVAHAAKKPAALRVLRAAGSATRVRVPERVLTATVPSGPATSEPKTPVVPPAVPVAVRIRIGQQGFEPGVVRVKAGARVTVTVERGQGCAAGFLMPDLGITKDNSSGPVTFGIGPLKPGTYGFTCGMGMVGGQLVAS